MNFFEKFFRSGGLVKSVDGLSILIFLILPLCFLLPMSERYTYFFLVLPWTFLPHSVFVFKNKDLIQLFPLSIHKTPYLNLIGESSIPIVLGILTLWGVFDPNSYIGSYSLYAQSTMYHAFLFFSYAGAFLLGYAFPRAVIDHIRLSRVDFYLFIVFKKDTGVRTYITWLGRPMFGILMYVSYYAITLITK